MSQQVLNVENVTMQFGGVVAVDNLNLRIDQGEIVALIGPNGAGKTTAFNVVTGVYQPTNGRVSFLGDTIIRNHPQGKMKKLYKGEHADLYTARPDLRDPEALKERYKVEADPAMAGWELLEQCARKRGFLISGGEVDTERMAKVLLDEYRGGRLGRITFEIPEDLEGGEESHGRA